MVELNREFLVKKFGQNELTSLTRIYLYRSQIKKIDSYTFKGLTKLLQIDLSYNEIEELDVSLFESLSNLEWLLLNYNRLKRVDSNTFQRLTNLVNLQLNNNAIEEIDIRLFESLSNLKDLHLYNNKLKRIDSNTFQKLTKLHTLWLHKNEIKEIEEKSFQNLSNLKLLWLNENKLKRIDANTFKGLTKLETLFLHNNSIEEIDVRSFESLSNLEALSLNNNRLKRIDSNIFNGLTKLNGLWLGNNEIEEIDVRLFESLSNLKRLTLNNNKLKAIDRKCFEPLKLIKLIEIVLLYENDSLKALSFISSSASKNSYDKEKVKIYGSLSKWSKFLKQFPELENQREEEAKERERKENEKQEKEALRQKVEEEEKNRIANQERDNNVKSSKSTLNQSTNKERDKIVQDQYISKVLNDRYEVVRKLGKGSFGLVYLVDDTKIETKRVKQKAMKIMDELDSATENELDLFLEINHENIVRYFDHFHLRIEGENQTFLITEYCENGDLKNKIEETKRLVENFSDKQILDWIIQATNALKYLHSKKPDPIIHRDIKPANMLLSRRNEIKLGDLGLSKLMDNTHASSYAGTPAYMSPEVFKAQFMEMAYYPNTDIWSLGCVLFELKFLTIAFPRGQYSDPPIPDASSSGIFSSILPKMLQKDCLVRISSRSLLTELENLSEAIV